MISYLGQIQLGDYVEYVDSIHLYSSGVNGLRINMICAGDYFNIDILQNFQSESIIVAFLKTLDDTNMEYTASKCIQFETIKDKTHITAGKQAEKYYKLPQ